MSYDVRPLSPFLDRSLVQTVALEHDLQGIMQGPTATSTMFSSDDFKDNQVTFLPGHLEGGAKYIYASFSREQYAPVPNEFSDSWELIVPVNIPTNFTIARLVSLEYTLKYASTRDRGNSVLQSDIILTTASMPSGVRRFKGLDHEVYRDMETGYGPHTVKKNVAWNLVTSLGVKPKGGQEWSHFIDHQRIGLGIRLTPTGFTNLYFVLNVMEYPSSETLRSIAVDITSKWEDAESHINIPTAPREDLPSIMHSFSPSQPERPLSALRPASLSSLPYAVPPTSIVMGRPSVSIQSPTLQPPPLPASSQVFSQGPSPASRLLSRPGAPSAPAVGQASFSDFRTQDSDVLRDVISIHRPATISQNMEPTNAEVLPEHSYAPEEDRSYALQADPSSNNMHPYSPTSVVRDVSRLFRRSRVTVTSPSPSDIREASPIRTLLPPPSQGPFPASSSRLVTTPSGIRVRQPSVSIQTPTPPPFSMSREPARPETLPELNSVPDADAPGRGASSIIMQAPQHISASGPASLSAPSAPPETVSVQTGAPPPSMMGQERERERSRPVTPPRQRQPSASIPVQTPSAEPPCGREPPLVYERIRIYARPPESCVEER